ncbi:EF-hand calcium-binding domain-containing protein 10 isoform X2 [Petromyzon marinus]|uniref:EF-hand calcium-binding domain-containing protein 10 isoform X2 n=1 Tax=Petromyzon marinus TaxID=7757 RepID=UPI003F71C892
MAQVEVEEVKEVEKVEAVAAREYLERHRLAALMELMMARVMAERPVLETLGAVGFNASPAGAAGDAVTLDTLTSEGVRGLRAAAATYSE